MKNEDSDKIDTIKNIKIESIKEIWIIIGGRKMWIRKCPQCDSAISHTTRNQKRLSEKRKRLCRNCYFKNFETVPFKGHSHSEETKNKIRIALLNRIKKIRNGQVFHNPIACQYFDKLNKEKDGIFNTL